MGRSAEYRRFPSERSYWNVQVCFHHQISLIFIWKIPQPNTLYLMLFKSLIFPADILRRNVSICLPAISPTVCSDTLTWSSYAWILIIRTRGRQQTFLKFHRRVLVLWKAFQFISIWNCMNCMKCLKKCLWIFVTINWLGWFMIICWK